jgi:uncharacterized protein YceH (UPF0502 family)
MDTLSPEEIRVIGCLLEKESTTPDQYPLSLNALTTACNQKSARDPVMRLSPDEVQRVTDGLVKKYLVSDRAGFGGRVTKYKHRFCNTEFGALQLSDQERGTLCVLMLRGPQTPGEIRARTQRLCEFGDVDEVESVLGALASHEAGPFVTRLPREPGKREARYAHLLGGPVAAAHAAAHEEPMPAAHPQRSDPPSPAGEPAGSRESLEARVAALEEALAELRRRLDVLAPD